MFKVPDTVFWETADMAGVDAVVTVGIDSGGSSWTNEAIRSRWLTILVCSCWRIGIPFSSAAGPDAVVVACVCESSQFWSYREKPRFMKRLSGSMCVVFDVLSLLVEEGFLHDIITFLGKEGVLRGILSFLGEEGVSHDVLSFLGEEVSFLGEEGVPCGGQSKSPGGWRSLTMTVWALLAVGRRPSTTWPWKVCMAGTCPMRSKLAWSPSRRILSSVSGSHGDDGPTVMQNLLMKNWSPDNNSLWVQCSPWPGLQYLYSSLCPQSSWSSSLDWSLPSSRHKALLVSGVVLRWWLGAGL